MVEISRQQYLFTSGVAGGASFLGVLAAVKSGQNAVYFARQADMSFSRNKAIFNVAIALCCTALVGVVSWYNFKMAQLRARD